MSYNWRQVKAIESTNKKKFLKQNETLNDNSGIYFLTRIDENGIKMDAVYFGEAQEFVDFVQAHDTISVTYYPEINVFQGRENLQVVIKNYC